MLLVQMPSAAGALYEHYNRFTEFDRHFSKYSKRYFGAGFDWRYFKAQAIAESGLQVDACASRIPNSLAASRIEATLRGA